MLTGSILLLFALFLWHSCPTTTPARTRIHPPQEVHYRFWPNILGALALLIGIGLMFVLL